MTDLDAQIAALREEVLRLDHQCQLAWGVSPKAVQEAEALYSATFDRLGRLVRRRLEERGGR
jgi:hypothetical protein